MQELILNKEQITDVVNIGLGIYKPLRGFLKKADFLSVVKTMRLKNGKVWPMPIVLDISKEEAKLIKKGGDILLKTAAGKNLSLLKNIEIYSYDKNVLCENVFKTKDKNHPGVANVLSKKEMLIGGDIVLLKAPKNNFSDLFLTPKQTKKIFEQKGFKTITAFQTRNVPHKGHEFLQKEALKITDGLFIQPVIGEKKEADFKDEFILTAYQLLIEKFFPKGRVVLGILPLKMKYAGPREAIMHALIRKNFGCTHFIVGRDHAGVGNYYGPFEAQEIFNKFKEKELGIKILKLKEVAWCPVCYELVFESSCPHQNKLQFFSGTKIRKALEENTPLPPYFLRPEIQQLLSNSPNPLVDNYYNNMQKNLTNNKGFVLWFYGLSGAGKTAIANSVFEKLKAQGKPTEKLDGDIVRQYLTADLGFSKEDRNENIKRVGFVAELLSKNGLGVVASFITPYKEQRDGLKNRINNFVEIFCSCPIEACEQRDTKGLYQKAKEGKIEHFTGISDPFEAPEKADIILDTSIDGTENIEKCANEVLTYLEKQKHI